LHRQQTDRTTPAKPEESKHVLSRPHSGEVEGLKRFAGLTLLLATTLLAACYLLLVTPSHAQSAPTVTDAGVESSFPDRLVFRASAESSSEIEKVRLRYKILPDGSSASGEAEFQPGTSISATLVLQGPDQPVFYLAPGTTIEYHWEVTDADGNTGRTEEASFFYDDDRFQWSHLDQGGVTIYYYAGSEDDAQAMLDVADENISKMTSLLGGTVDFPVKVWIYDSVDDMRPAIPRRSATYEESVITAGIRITTDTVLVLGEASSLDTLRHELTHVVTAASGESAFGTLPAWLDEGTAVFSQKDPGGFEDAIKSAIDRGNVLSVRSITSSPGDPGKVNLFYGESWHLVKYLVETYGEDKFGELFATIKGGKRIDGALEAVYGFDQDGLEDEWRAANGLPARETPQPTAPAQDEPTDPPDRSNGSQAGTSDDGGTSTGTVVIIAVATLALAALIALAGFTLARRFH
jgi:hypothetical protein